MPIAQQAGHEIVAAQKLFQPTSNARATESRHTYFFVIKNSARAKAMTGMAIVGGLARTLVAAAVTSKNNNPGPVDLHALDEATRENDPRRASTGGIARRQRARRKIAGPKTGDLAGATRKIRPYFLASGENPAIQPAISHGNMA